jgi:hypothetical protein
MDTPIESFPNTWFGEGPTLTVDFTDRLFPNGTLSSPSVKAFNSAGADVTSSILSGNALLNNTDVTVPVIQNGKIVGSRAVVTNKAIMQAVREDAPAGSYILEYQAASSISTEKPKEKRRLLISA